MTFPLHIFEFSKPSYYIIAVIEALYNMASLHYEVLKGDKAGISSIRVNDQYRIEFTVSYQETETIIYICNILDLSNHYQ